MSRVLHIDISAEVEKHGLNVQGLIHMAFDSGDLRLWTGVNELIAGGETWIGGGQLIKISRVSETSEVVAEKVDFGLSGIDSSIIAIALGENYQGRAVEMFLCFFDDDGQPIQSPLSIYKGMLDVMEIEQTGRTADIVVRAESRLRQLRQAPLTRYTDQDQKSLYPGDRGFEFVAAMQEKRLIWGRA